MVDLALRAQFHRARTRWLGLALTRDLAWSLALLFASALLCFHLDRQLVLSPLARLVWGVGTLLLAAGIGAGRGWFSFRRQPDDRAVALRMERRHPELRERLLSAVELDRLPQEERRRFSSGLLTAVQEEAQQAAQRLDFRRAATWAEASLAVAACAVVGLACLVQASLTPAAVSAWWGRMLTPSADIAVYRNTRVRVSPREALLLRGGDLGVTIATEGRPVDHATLHFRVGSGSWTQVDLRSPFTHRLQGLTETTQFFATAGDGKSDRGTARVVDPPALAGLQMRYRFPTYMARLDQVVTGVSGTLSVPAGTRVELALAANKPLRTASLEWGPRMATLPVSGSTASGSVTILGDTAVHIRMRDTDGFAAPASQRLDFHAVPDEAPEVRVEQPTGDQDVVSDASVPLHVVATDDYGLHQLSLAHRIERGDTRAAAAPAIPLRLAEGGRSQRELDARARWNLSALSLHPGDVVVYHAEASDYDDLAGPHIGRSGEQRLRIVDRAEMEHRLAEGWTEWDRQLAQVIQEQAETRAAVQTAKSPAALAEAERRQRDLAPRADELARRAGELAEMARTNHLAAEPTVLRQERAGTELSDISHRAMPDAADRIHDSASAPASRAPAEARQAEIVRRLQALRRQAQPESDLEALARRAEELARAEAELQGQSQRLLPQTLGLALGELVPDQRASLVRMSQSQTALQQTTGQYEENLQRVARGGPEPAIAASRFMRDRAIPERQGEAARHVAGNTLARAAVGQQGVAADLRRVAILLRLSRQNASREASRQQAMARAMRELDRMLQQHAELMRRTAAQPNTARSRQLAREERALRQQAARMSEQLRRAGVPSQSLQSAAQRMAQAERRLNQGTPKAAQSPQQQAQEAMRQMARQLQDPQGDRQAEAERQQLRRALNELAQRQGMIGKALQRPREQSDGRSAAAQLAPRQEAISRSAKALNRRLPSETFRSAMGQAEGAMKRSGDALRRGDTGKAPLSASRQAERLLQEMARALEEQTPGSPRNGQQGQSGGAPRAQSARELARRLADMRLLRSMEQGLRDETGEADQQSGDREQRLRDLARRQAQTRGATARVGDALRRIPGIGQRVGEAAGAMGQAQRGLQNGSAGAETQGAQATAIMRLTQAIGQGQQQLQAMTQPGPGQPGSQNGPQNRGRGQQPALDSIAVRGSDQGGPRALVPTGRRGFGLLSPGDQQALRQGGREKVPADYADLVRRYYRTLSERGR